MKKLYQFSNTLPVTLITFSFSIGFIIQIHPIKGRSVVMQAIERVKIHYSCQMHKTADKHFLFPRKIVYIKRLSSISLMNKV